MFIDLNYFFNNRINQDCLENLFAQIRSKGAQRTNPNSTQFRHAIKQVIRLYSKIIV